MTFERRVGVDDQGVVRWDGASGDAGWQVLDLKTLTRRIALAGGERSAHETRARFGGLPALSEAERPPVDPARTGSGRRVPAHAFVTIGARGSLAPRTGAAFAARGPDEAPAENGRWRRRLRELFFLVILALTVAGAFYTGRLHGDRVLVVPGPESARSVVT